REILAAANTALGGGALPVGYDYAQLSSLIAQINEGFDGGLISQWVKDSFDIPCITPVPPGATFWAQLSQGGNPVGPPLPLLDPEHDGVYTGTITGLAPGCYDYEVYMMVGATKTVIGQGHECISGTFENRVRWPGLGTICGFKWEDLNANGVIDHPPENGLGGWTIQLFSGATLLSPTTTLPGGAYCFTGLEPGTYTVKEVQQDGWTRTYPAGESHDVTLSAGQMLVFGKKFGNRPPLGSLSGQKWGDCNDNGVWDKDTEFGMMGWTINLYRKAGDTYPVTPTATTLTGPNGVYSFTGLLPGTYRVEEVLKTGWEQTKPVNPSSYEVTLDPADMNEAGLDFGNHWISTDQVTFVGYDGTTQGYWQKVYGNCLYVLPNPNWKGSPELHVGPDWFSDHNGQYNYQDGLKELTHEVGSLDNSQNWLSWFDFRVYTKGDPATWHSLAFTWPSGATVDGNNIVLPENYLNDPHDSGYYASVGGAQYKPSMGKYFAVTWDSEYYSWEPLIAEVKLKEPGIYQVTFDVLNPGNRDQDFTLYLNGDYNNPVWTGHLDRWLGNRYLVFMIRAEDPMTVALGAKLTNNPEVANAYISGIFVDNVCRLPHRGHIVVDKVTDPSPDPTATGFAFTTTGTGYNPFSLKDADPPNDQALPPGSYGVTETVPDGWDLTKLVCDDPDGGTSVNLAGATATIDLDAGETVTCTFTDREELAEKTFTLTIPQTCPPGFEDGMYVTYTMGGWGAPPAGNNVGQLLADNFATVYASDVVVGIPDPGDFSMKFTAAHDIEAYLPAGGPASKLTSDHLNPVSTESGVFGGQVLALQLAVDFSDGGVLPPGLGDLVYVKPGDSLDGKTIREILAAANTALGGGALPVGYDYAQLSSLIAQINEGFDEGLISQWVKDSFDIPCITPVPPGATFWAVLNPATVPIGPIELTDPDHDGVYTGTFSNLVPGHYAYRVYYKIGATETTISEDPDELISGSVNNPVTWPGLGMIGGFKWEDMNANGVIDHPPEGGLGSWVIQLYKGATLLDTFTTLPGGAYFFTGLEPGTYTVKEVQQDGWTRTYPAGESHEVTLSAGQMLVFGKKFGNQPQLEGEVVKAVKTYARQDGSVTYEYGAGNGGTVPLEHVRLTDDKCSPVNGPTGGDSNGNGKLDHGEIWFYSCTYSPAWNPDSCELKNIVTMWEDQLALDTSYASIYPVTITKDVVDRADNTQFTVKLSKFDTGSNQYIQVDGTSTVSEDSPLKLWLVPGTFKFEEINLPAGYTASPPIEITLPAVTCPVTRQFTNTRQTGKIELKKHWVGTAGTATIHIGTTEGGHETDQETVSGQDGTTGMNTVDTGTYYLSETALSGYDAVLTCVDQQQNPVAVGEDGDVLVTKDKEITCTITNTEEATVTVVKTAIGGDATFDYTGTIGNPFSLTTVSGSASKVFTFENLPAGGVTKTVIESAPNAPWAFTSLVCDPVMPVSGRTVTITVKPGDDITCTYTNTRQETVTKSFDLECGPGGFEEGDYYTYTQGGWGGQPAGQNVGQLLYENFDDVYPSGYVEVGIPGSGGFSMTFSGPGSIQKPPPNYLPAGGTAGPLDGDYTFDGVDPDPTSTGSGVFGGQVLALQLNVDFAAAGKTGGDLGPLVLTGLTDEGGYHLSYFNGMTVSQVLALANQVLGGATPPDGITVGDLNQIADLLNNGFDNGVPTGWAQLHVVAPCVPGGATAYASLSGTGGPLSTSLTQNGLHYTGSITHVVKGTYDVRFYYQLGGGETTLCTTDDENLQLSVTNYCLWPPAS
ncbi:MAG: hypothetical protein LUQ64_01495, partial [Methanomicrobiales archaeon]|nr:hypothetical protein [Methanomicrobiales archaeon]